MLEVFFGITGAQPPISVITGEMMLPVTAIALVIAIIVNIKRKTGVIRTLFWVAVILYMSALIELFFFPIPCYPSEWAVGREYSNPSVNFVPFVNILSAQHFVIVRNLLGNILVFVPLGFLVPYMIKGEKKIKKTAFVVVSSSVGVELIQFIGSFLIFRMGWKVVDIDDVIMNTIGGLIGILCYSIFNTLSHNAKPMSVTM